MVIKRSTVLITLLYLSIIIICMGNAASHPFTYYIGDSGDSEQFMAYLGWFEHALVFHQNLWYSRAFNYPYGLNLMSNTSLWIESIFFSPLVALVGVVFSYNLLFAFNGYLMLWMMKEILQTFIKRFYLSILGSIFFFLSPYMVGQSLGHPNLYIISPVLAIILIALRQRNKTVRNDKTSIIISMLLIVQFYSSLEIFTSFLLSVLIFMICYFLFDYKKINSVIEKILSNFRTFLLMMLITLIGCLPWAMYYFLGPNLPSYNVNASLYNTDLVNLFIPSSLSFWRTPWTMLISNHLSANSAEQDGFIGLLVVLLLIFAVYKNRTHKMTWTITTYLFIMVTFSLGNILHFNGKVLPILMPWSIYGSLPILRNLLMNRFFVYIDMVIIIFLFVNCDEWMNGKKIKSQLILFIGVLLAFIEWLPTLPLTTTAFPMSLEHLIKTKIIHRIKNQPVFIVGVSPSEAMGLDAALHYHLSLVNFYGFASNVDLIAKTEFLPILNYHRTALDFINPLASTHATYILLIDSTGYATYKTEYQSLTFDLGQPTYVHDPISLWKIPNVQPGTMTILSTTLRGIRRFHAIHHQWPQTMLPISHAHLVPSYYELFTKNPVNVDMPIPLLSWQVINNNDLQFSVLSNAATLQFIAKHWHLKKTQYQIHAITFSHDMYRMNQFLAGQPIDPTQNPYEGTFILTQKNR